LPKETTTMVSILPCDRALYRLRRVTHWRYRISQSTVLKTSQAPTPSISTRLPLIPSNLLTMFQVASIRPITMGSAILRSPQEEAADTLPRLPRRGMFETNNSNTDSPPRRPPRSNLQSFNTIDLGEFTRAAPRRGVSRSHSRFGDNSLNKLHIPGQTKQTSPEQDMKVFQSLPLTVSQKYTIMKYCTNWWEV
jgi:hypothetical protein